MASRAAYDDDFFTWSQEQAALLRALPGSGRDLPNALDIENIAEEIESVGRSELGKVESYLGQIVIHLLKLASLPDDAAPIRHWRSEIYNCHGAWQYHYVPSMRQNIALERIWRRSVKIAAGMLENFGDRLLPFSQACPLIIDDLLNETIAIDALVAKLRLTSTSA